MPPGWVLVGAIEDANCQSTASEHGGQGRAGVLSPDGQDYRAAVDRVYADDPNCDEEVDAELGTLARRLALTLSRGDVRSREQKHALKPVGVL
ncbi:hypothetical protein MTY59_40910 [Mycobacterium senriense]|uniref:DUF222 domain-containing protein n=1 Tax=Mycobacterium senriense TaxID=2775496 RepID=A0ABN6IP70_9MYCO|nr:hypothetical protein MTY59_40910 [Mycobacterium senriense]